MRLSRRRLIVSAAGAGVAISGLAGPPSGLAALSASDDELAYANFGLATEFLLHDFYARSVAARVFGQRTARDFARAGLNSSEHADALAKLLIDAGQTAAVPEDFEFSWPDGTFAGRKPVSATGLVITRALLGVYTGAAAGISITSYRTLFASMAANVAQQVGCLSQLAGSRAIGISFPPAFDIQAASDAIDNYLG